MLGSLSLVVFSIPTGTKVRFRKTTNSRFVKLSHAPLLCKARIEDLVVDRDARGKGIGKALVRHALAEAGRLGAASVDLTSRPSREEANRLYLSVGFEVRDTNVYRYRVPSAVS